MSGIQVESGVPLQMDWERNTTMGIRYPFAGMEVGDSFFIPVEDREERAKRRARVSVAANGFSQRLRNRGGEDRAYIARVRTGEEPDEPNSVGGVRVWRVR